MNKVISDCLDRIGHMSEAAAHLRAYIAELESRPAAPVANGGTPAKGELLTEVHRRAIIEAVGKAWPTWFSNTPLKILNRLVWEVEQGCMASVAAPVVAEGLNKLAQDAGFVLNPVGELIVPAPHHDARSYLTRFAALLAAHPVAGSPAEAEAARAELLAMPFEQVVGMVRGAAEPMPASEAPDLPENWKVREAVNRKRRANMISDAAVGEIMTAVRDLMPSTRTAAPVPVSEAPTHTGSAFDNAVNSGRLVWDHKAGARAIAYAGFQAGMAAAPVPASEAAKQMLPQDHAMPPMRGTDSQRDADDAARDLDKTMKQRDDYHDMADKLAEAIAAHFGVYLGEHSSDNCPWTSALEIIESATQLNSDPSSNAGSARQGGNTNDSTTSLAAPAAPTDATFAAQQNAELVLARLEQMHKDSVPGTRRDQIEEAMPCALAVVRHLIAPSNARPTAADARSPCEGVTPEAVEWSYSTNEENYHGGETSREAIIQVALAEIGEATGTFWIGKNRRFNGRGDADSVIERLQEQAYDECGEYAETYLEDVTKDEKNELDSLITDWAARADRSTFWTVYDTEQIDIEAAIAAAQSVRDAAQPTAAPGKEA